MWLGMIDWTAEDAEGAESKRREERFEIDYKLSIEIAFHAIEFFMGMIDWTAEGAEGAEVEKREIWDGLQIIDWDCVSCDRVFHGNDWLNHRGRRGRRGREEREIWDWL